MTNSLLLTPTTSLEDAIRKLDQGGSGFLAVVDHQNKLLGVITDGDLRRAILNRQFQLELIINYKPVTMPATTSRVQVKKKLLEIRRRHMPLVDEQGHLVDVVVLDDFKIEKKPNWVVVMAGGMGTRLGELTRDTPKPMLKVGNKPILERIVELFKAQGFHKFIFCVNYKSDVIEAYFGEGGAFGVEIRYTREQQRLGTAGALSLIDFPLQDPFFVVNGDVLASVNFEDFLNFHQLQQAKASMCVKHYLHQIPYACVEFDEAHTLLALKEKPKQKYYINAGVYLLDPSLLPLVPKNTYFDMPTFIETAIAREPRSVKVFYLSDYWLDIGQPTDYQKANEDLG